MTIIDRTVTSESVSFQMKTSSLTGITVSMSKKDFIAFSDSIAEMRVALTKANGGNKK